MASIVDIVLRIKKQGEGVKDTEDSLLKLGKTVAVAAAAVTAFGVAANKAFDIGKQGAAITQTAQSFDLLLDKVGAGPGLFDDLKDAAGGTISEFQIMTSTATLLAGASGDLGTSLANATPELLEIARAANKLNPSLGDTTFLYESLARGIKRASPLILDNLGLTIKVGEANEVYAAALGKTAEQLTAEERQQALLNETLRAGGVLIDQVGGSVDSLTDTYSRFSTASGEATNRMKEQVNQAIAPLVEGLTEGILFSNQLNDAVDALGATFIASTTSVKLANGEVVSYAEAIEMAAKRTEMAEQANDGWASSLLSAGDAAEEMADAAGASMDDLKGLTDQMILTSVAGDMSGDALRDLAVQMGFISESEAMLIAREQELESLRQAGIISAQEYALRVSSLREALDDLPENKRINILLDIQGAGGLSALNKQLGSLGGDIARHAGGPLSGVNLVGEKGQELVINGMVIPNDVTEWLLKSGVIKPDQGLQTGGTLFGDFHVGGTVRSGLSGRTSSGGLSTPWKPDAIHPGAFHEQNPGLDPAWERNNPNFGGGGTSSQQTTQQQSAAIQQVATEAAVSAATQAASGASQSSQTSAGAQIGVQVRAGISDIGDDIRGSNDRMIAELQGLRDDIRRLERAQEDMIERVVDIA